MPYERAGTEQNARNTTVTAEPLKPQLHMRRPDLTDLPPIALPAGYALRFFQDGDAAHWSRIIQVSFGWPPEQCDFAKIMRADAAFLPERIMFITHQEQPVATASAYYRASFMPDFGMLHYVGVLPGHQGMRLGYWVSLAALWRMRDDSRRGAWLSTDDFRLPAIKTYLALGFEPLLIHENQRERWPRAFTALGRPELTARFSANLAGAIYRPPSRPT